MNLMPADTALCEETTALPASKTVTRFQRLVIWLSLSTFIAQPVLVSAQVVAAAGAGANKPQVGAAANGVTVVQIVAPSASGVSHNQYQQYDVSARGVVLNNSQVVVQTQQAGYIAGNPALAGGAARIILNEVTSNLPSTLRGFTEVGGNKAEVIIANPNGITCDGCGFINTSRGVLTTGTPVFGASGNLDAFRVTSGAISIEGAGLNGANTDQVDLIARAVKLNAELWGKSLNVIAGANQVASADLSTTQIAGTGSAPAVAIDVAALGGMYANKIRLVGTEAGVGVVNAGTLAAQAGDLTIDSAGRITLSGTTQASGRIDIAAQQDINNSGTTYAQGAATLTSQSGINNTGLLAAQGNLTLSANSLNTSGTLAAGMASDGTVSVQADLSVATRGVLKASGSQAAGGNIKLSGSSLDLSGADVRAGGDISLNAGTGGIDHRAGTLAAGGSATLVSEGGVDNRSGGKMLAGNDLSITADGAILNDGGTLAGNGGLNIHAASLDNRGGTVYGGTRLDITTRGALINASGLLQSSGGLTVSAVGALDNSDGRIEANDTLSLSAASVDNTEGRIVNVGTGLAQIDGGAAIINRNSANRADRGEIRGNGDVLITAAQIANTSNGLLKAANDLTLNVSAALNNAGGKIFADRDAALNLGSLTGAGSVLSERDLTLNFSGNAGNDAGSTLQANRDLKLHSLGGLINQGTIKAVGKLTLESTSLDNRAGATINAAETAITTHGNLSNAGRIDGTALTITASDLSNTGTIMGKTLVLNAANLTNAGSSAVIVGFDSLDAIISAALSNRDGATLYSKGDLNLGASTRRDADDYLADSMASFTNSSAWVQAGGKLRLSANQITNKRSVLDIRWSAERSGDYVDGNPRYTKYYSTEYVGSSTTQAGQLLSDSDMWLKGNILNEYSHIGAGGNLKYTLSQLRQTARTLMETRSDRGVQDNWQYVKTGSKCNWIRQCKDVFEWVNSPIDYSQQTTYAVGSVDATLTANQRQSGTVVDFSSQTVSSTHGSSATLGAITATSPGGSGVNGTLTLPVSGLFNYRQGPVYPYLIETDPRFADYGKFMSSDYMLSRLKFDPDQNQKRIGNGFVEQKMISDQIIAQTGRRFLAGNTNADAQFKTLMESGLAAASALELRPGIALTEAQINALGQNIVWLVEQNVTLPGGGTERVLVPQVYLTRTTSIELKPNGALIAAADVDLSVSGTLANSGTLRGDTSLRLAAADILNTRGGTLISDGAAELLASNDIVNQSGRIQGGQLTLAAGRDIRNERVTESVQLGATATTRIFDEATLTATAATGTGVQMQAGRDVLIAAGKVSSASDTKIVAGRNLSLDTVTARQQIVSGEAQRGQETQLTSSMQSAGNITLVAANDATLTAAQLASGKDLTLAAGGNIALKAAKDSTLSAFDGGSTKNRYYDESVKGSQLTAGGQLQIAAVNLGGQAAVAGGGNVTLEAATLQAVGGAVIAADNNVSIVQVSERHEAMQEIRSKKSGFFSSSSRSERTESTRNDVVGSQVSGENVTVQTGQDITVRGSALQAAKELKLSAGRDVLVEAAIASSTASRTVEEKKSGFASGALSGIGIGTSTESQSANAQSSSRSVGSTLSAGSIETYSGRDTRIEGSVAVADNDLSINAGRDLSILSAQNTAGSQSSSSSKTSGFIGSWWQPAVGTVKQNQTTDSATTLQSASQVASLGGNVELKAGEHYTQKASDVLAPQGNIDITAKQIDILAGSNSQRVTETREYQKTAIGGSVSVPLVNAVMGIANVAKSAGQTSDPRMQALAAATVAMQAKTVVDSAQAIASGSMGGVKVSVSLGTTKTESRSEQSSETVAGSTVVAGNDVRLNATGAGKESDLTIQGSNASAGRNLTLAADDEIRLQAAANTSDIKNTNSNSGASIGVGFAFGGAQNGFTLELGANKGRGNANGTDVAWTNTHVTAGKVLALQSGGDTSLKGAVVSGQQITANILGDLKLESLQDISRFDAKQQSAGFGLSLCIPPFCYGASTGSVSAGGSKINSDYASVTEQTGMKAGDQGFRVAVKGNTDLTGAVVASTDKAVQENKNSFTTGGKLTLDDIQNKADYDASGYAVTLSGSTKLGDQTSEAAQSKMTEADKAAAATKTTGLGPSSLSGAGVGKDSGRASSTTQSGISGIAGNTAVRTGDAETGITKIFDAGKVQKNIDAQVAITKAFTQESIKLASAIVDSVKQSDKGPKKIVLTRTCESNQLDCNSVQEIDLANHVILSSPNGEVYIFNHGIDNTEKQALENAGTQMGNEALKQGVYTVINPHTGSFVAEVVYAGLDKLREITGWTDLLGISNASQANIDLRDKISEYNKQIVESGGTPLLIVNGVDHSRGSLTDSNAVQAQINAGQTTVPIGSVTFNGAAANAERMAERVNAATSGTGSVLQSTHKDDLVGGVIGGNAQTGGLSSSFIDAHTTYGPNVKDDNSDRVWGAGIKSQPLSVGAQP